MNAVELYNQLEKDFVRPSIVENWYDYDSLTDIAEYVCDNFKERSMGLLCDFADEITKVYTAVFPSDKVLTKILDDGATNAMLFVHHPCAWDLGKELSKAFYPMNTELLEKLKARRVALFNFHYPLDNFGEYSTSKTLADILGISIEKAFAECDGAMCGVIGITDCKDIHELNARYSQTVGHATKLYQYGSDKIVNNRVGICAGGGNDAEVVSELIESNINVLISGLSLNNRHSAEAHKLEKENCINLIGGTHYSSEKFACIAICKYFENLGIVSEFIHDMPCFEDL